MSSSGPPLLFPSPTLKNNRKSQCRDHLKNIFQSLPLPTLPDGVPGPPVLAIKLPKLLPRLLARLLREPPGHKLLARRLARAPLRPLLLLHPVLLDRRLIIFTILHGALIRAQPRVRRRQVRLQPVRHRVQRDDERGEVERDVRGAGVCFPHQERLLATGSTTGVAGRRRSADGVLERGRDRPFVARGEAGVDLVVPAPRDAPPGLAVAVHDFAAHLVGGAGFPAAGLEVQGADFAGGVVADFHGAVVVDGRVAGDDADDGRGNLFPGVEFGSGVWSGGAEA